MRFSFSLRQPLLLLAIVAIWCWRPDASPPNASQSAAAEIEQRWERDLAVAQRIATENDRDLLIVFTGHGWCQPCEIFDRQVVQQPEFTAGVAKDFVCVEFDMNFGETEAEQEREKLFRSLQKKYLAEGVPTLLLADAAGQPYCVMFGPDPSGGPQPIIEKIHAAQAAQVEREQLLANAGELEGPELAAARHDALLCLAPYLAPHGNGQDPLLAFYADEIEQLSKLLPESSPIRDYYRDRESQRADKRREQEIYARINEFWETQDFDSAIEFVATALDEETNADRRWHLEMQRVSFLVAAKKHEETLQHIAKLLEADDLSDGNRSSLVRSELHSLTALNKTDEALARLNAHLESSAKQPKLRQKLLYEKANWFDRRNQRPEATAAWSAYREEFAPNTFDRLTGSAALARSLQKENKHREAIALFEEILAALQLAEQGKIELNWPWSFRKRGFMQLGIAESQLALGDEAAARQRLDEAAANVEELAASPLNGERETAESMRKQEQDLRTRLAEAEQQASE
jgi:thioredoxin-related protein